MPLRVAELRHVRAQPARVVVLGAGVAGLQAVATARRLGAVVYVSDIRPAVKEQVESLGARFIDPPEMEDKPAESGGYAKQASDAFLAAQRQQLSDQLAEADVAICTAQVPGRRAPRLISEDMLDRMRPGSVVVDLAVAQGGNCADTVPSQTVDRNGVKLIGANDLPCTVPNHASFLYSKNLLALLQPCEQPLDVSLGKPYVILMLGVNGVGKTTLLKQLCQSVTKAYPEIKLYALLIDERPEEVTDFKRSVTAQVHASSSDESYANHIRVADKLLDSARKQAGEGHDVMIVIDSLTRLSRVHNSVQKSGGRTMSGGIDAKALEVPRRLFGAARNIENGGSLTILATVLADTGSRMDQVIFEEFKGTGNMEIVLSRDIAAQRVYPALDIAKSSTRREELLFDPKSIEQFRMLRRGLTQLKPIAGAKKLVELLEKYPSNEVLLQQLFADV